MTSEEARQQAQAEKFTLVVAKSNMTGYFRRRCSPACNRLERREKRNRQKSPTHLGLTTCMRTEKFWAESFVKPYIFTDVSPPVKFAGLRSTPYLNTPPTQPRSKVHTVAAFFAPKS